MMAQEISIPVYFSKYNGILNEIIEDIKKSIHTNPEANAKRESAIAEILGSISANGYQVILRNIDFILLNYIQ